jgi:hypothetical protein
LMAKYEKQAKMKGKKKKRKAAPKKWLNKILLI